jgi:hypothetical protein
MEIHHELNLSRYCRIKRTLTRMTARDKRSSCGLPTRSMMSWVCVHAPTRMSISLTFSFSLQWRTILPTCESCWTTTTSRRRRPWSPCTGTTMTPTAH